MKEVNNRELKLKYDRMFEIVRNELNKVDPMGLKPDEFCPIDEYNPETSMVLLKLKTSEDYIKLSKNISLIFSEMFGEDFSESMFYDCAKNILEKINAL